MSRELLVKVGQMPGRINEFAVQEGNTIREALELAGLDYEGFQVKVDGVVTSDLDKKIALDTALILVTDKTKGNADFTVKIGQMPGRINEFALSEIVTVKEALEIAGIDYEGYQVKLDGAVVSYDEKVTPDNALLLVTDKTKGNASFTLKVGQMPGRINEYAFETPVSVREALEIAGIDFEGYQVKLDGEVVGYDAQVTENNSLLLVTDKTKGNN